MHLGRYIPWMHLSAAGALHLTANVVAYIGPVCSYDVFLTLGLLLAVALSAGKVSSSLIIIFSIRPLVLVAIAITNVSQSLDVIRFTCSIETN